ncbi:MAG: hypothetical protein Q7R83_01760 [bacterium]|nr:hypothetical protein [bacterium]
MSWQRILETARRHGFPVIVTDVAGREPTVVVPLNEYERLLEQKGMGESPRQPFAGTPTRVQVREKIGSDRPEIVKIETVDKFEATSAQGPEMTLKEIVRESIPIFEEAASSVPKEGEDLSLEERFYLEPMDEEENTS